MARPPALASRSLVAEVRSELRAHGDPRKAAGAQAYMKSALPYYGVPAPLQRAIFRKVFARHRLATSASWRATVLELWRKAGYREERYAAIALTEDKRHAAFQTLDALPLYEEMIVTGAWWDYVDAIASHRLGELLRRYPAPMKKRMRAWSRGKNLWKRRSAILCQLGFKNRTDLKLLYACIRPNLDDKEFFIRKAIGWALRQYAWTDPREVRRFVEENGKALSPLSKREALKNCGPR